MFLRSTTGIRTMPGIYLAGKFSRQPMGPTIKMLVDSGAEVNMVTAELLREVKQAFRPAHPDEVTRVAGGVMVPNRGWIELPLFSGELMYNGLFLVQDAGPDRCYDMVLGMPWFAEVCPIIDWSLRSVDVCDDSDFLVRLPLWDQALFEAGRYESEVVGSVMYCGLVELMKGSWLNES